MGYSAGQHTTCEVEGVLRFWLMVGTRCVLGAPSSIIGEAQHEALCWFGRVGQGDLGLHHR